MIRMIRGFRSSFLLALCALLITLAACGANTDTFPAGAAHPTPVTTTYRNCPPQGSAGDPTLNTRENRVDDASSSAYNPVALDTLIGLPYPGQVAGRARTSWPSESAKKVAQDEGVAIQTSGYVVAIRYVGPEPVNCNSADTANYYLWISDNASDPPALAMVVVLTPRILAQRPGWTQATIRSLAGRFVQVSGWLLFNNQPPSQLGLSRATPWELHPVLHLAVDEQSQWHNIDQKPL
ncbi:MAG: hypothetical protein ABI068_14925 [Ktedonobacterales bacterium]